MVDLGLDEPVNRLVAGEVDLFAYHLPLRATGVAVGPTISRTSRTVLLAAGHPLAARSFVRWDDLADFGVAEPIKLPEQLRASITPTVTPNGRSLRRVLRVTTLTEVLAGVANGQIVHPTVSTFADHANFPGIVSRPIVDAAMLESAVLYRSGPQDAPVAAFLDIAKVYADLTAEAGG